MVTNSTRQIADLPLHIFDKLISQPRALANPTIDVSTLRKQILSKLKATNVNNADAVTCVRDLLKLSPPMLMRLLDPCLTYVECNRLLSRIHRECTPRPLSVMEMIRRTARQQQRQLPDAGSQQTSSHSNTVIGIGKIPTGLPTLDAHLHGGVSIGSVTEIVGRAGVGKTHLAQQLCVLAAKSNGGATYIDAEKKLNLHRLREIALERFISDQSNNANCTGQNLQQQPHAHELAQQVLENVAVHQILTTNELLETLEQLEDEIINRNSLAEQETAQLHDRKLPVRLVVIDSVAAPIRRDFDMVGGGGASSSRNTATHRASAIFQIAKRLKQLAYDYQLAVVVINQVGAGGGRLSTNKKRNREDGTLQRNDTLDIRDGTGEFTASLGTAWQYCVTTRIVLEHESDPHRLLQQQQQEREQGGQQQQLRTENMVRTATLAKSLVSKRTTLSFELTKEGVCEVPPATEN